MTSSADRYFIESERLGFRCWSSDDLPLAQGLWGNAQVTKLFSKVPLTPDQVKTRLAKEIDQEQQYGVQYWPMFLLADGAHIGCAGLRPHSEGILEFGVHLLPQYWSVGLATEAGRRIIEHAFADDLAQVLFAGHHPDNRLSRNMLLKLGFVGTQSQHYPPTGLEHPSYLLYSEPQPYSTRVATTRDARALAVVHHQSIKATFAGVLDEYVAARPLDYCEATMERCVRDAERHTLVLLHGEQIVGFAAIAPSHDPDLAGTAGLLDRIYLHPSACGAGHGNAMMQWAETQVKELGFAINTLWVFATNERARHFYKRWGYEPDGVTKQEYGSYLLRYRKKLDA